MNLISVIILIVLSLSSLLPSTCVYSTPLADAGETEAIMTLDVCHEGGSGIIPASDMPCIGSICPCMSVHHDGVEIIYHPLDRAKPFLVASSEEHPPEA